MRTTYSHEPVTERKVDLDSAGGSVWGWVLAAIIVLALGTWALWGPNRPHPYSNTAANEYTDVTPPGPPPVPVPQRAR